MKAGQKRMYSLRTKMMVINASVTLSSLILCAILFILSVWLIVGKYMSKDLDFFLTETNDNIKAKITYMETIIYQIRDSETVMEYLKIDATSGKEAVQNEFHRVVNISSDKNFGSNSEPIIEKVYLFQEDGDYLSTFYYAMIKSEIKQSNDIMAGLHQDYLTAKHNKQKQDYGFYTLSKDRGYLAYTLFNDEMIEQGTVIFEIRLDSLRNLMKGVQDYNNAFWLLFDDKGNVLSGIPMQPALNTLDSIKKSYHYTPYTQLLGQTYYRLYTDSLALNMNSVIGIPKNQMALLLFDSVKIYVIIIAAITLVSLVIFVILTYRMTKPIQDVTDKMQLVKSGDFSTKLPDYNNLEFHEISMVFNDMTAYVNHLINQVYEKQLSVKEMELKFLQTQMNPHFMFNVLNTIALKARMDNNEEVFKMISSFSQLIQAKIYRSDTEKVQIKQEIEYVQYYLYLQSFRYAERLSYSIRIEDEEVMDMYIPKLCIQLIVENAVVHGIEPKMEQGEVLLVLYIKENSVYIDIIDNGLGFEQEGHISLPIEHIESSSASHNHVGLNNANHIIQLMYGEEYGITIYSSREEGTTVSIHIPCDIERESTDALKKEEWEE